MCNLICELIYLPGQPASSVYTIDVTRAHTNAGYISTEGANKTSQQTNDGLPTYEEAIAGGKGTVLPTPSTQSVVPSETCIPIEAPTNENIAIDTGERRGRRHHHRRHRHHRESAAENTDSNGAQNPGEHHRRRHKRGLRHLTKINRRNRHSETDQ